MSTKTPEWYRHLAPMPGSGGPNRRAQIDQTLGPHYAPPHFEVPANPEGALPVRAQLEIGAPGGAQEGQEGPQDARQVSAATLPDLDRIVQDAGISAVDASSGVATGSYDVEQQSVLRFNPPNPEVLHLVALLADPASRAKTLENAAYARGYLTGSGGQEYPPPTEGGILLDEFARGVGDGAKQRHRLPAG